MNAPEAPTPDLHPNIAGDLIDTKRRDTQNHQPVLTLRNPLNEYRLFFTAA